MVKKSAAGKRWTIDLQSRLWPASYMKSIQFKFFLLLVAGVAGCASQPPKALHQVTCRYYLQQCHVKARDMCAYGYTIHSSIRAEKTGGPWGRYSEFIMKYWCN